MIFIRDGWKLLPLFILTSVLGYSQPNLSYNGAYNLSQYRGVANYQFIFEEGDSVLNGPFTFNSSNVKRLIEEVDNRFSLSAHFNRSVPSNQWRFVFDKFKVATEPIDIIDNQYQLRVDGVHHVVDGGFLDGKYNGLWTHTVEKLKNSEVQTALFKSSINFKQGIPQKEFRVENEELILAGRFLRDGLGHDVWELFSLSDTEASEKWKFNNGRLEFVERKRGDSISTTPFYSQPLIESKVISLDRQYLEILQLQSIVSASNQAFSESRIAELLEENAQYYTKLTTILSHFEHSTSNPDFRVLVLDNPLKNSELNNLNYIINSYEKIELIANRLLESTPINLLKLTDENTLFLTKVIERLYEKHIPLLAQIKHYADFEVLQHVPREELFTQLWPTQDAFTHLEIDYSINEKLKKRKYIQPNTTAYLSDSVGLFAVKELCRFTYDVVTTIQQEINNKLTTEQQEQELMEIEEQLIDKVTRFNALSDSLQIQAFGRNLSTLKKIKSKTTAELATYSQLKDISQKLEQSNTLKDCLEEMKALSLTISELDNKNMEIIKTYTDRVWNPFTSTLMDEQVKKRITGAYFEFVQPDLIQSISDDLSCTNVADLDNKLTTQHDLILDLRDNDTDKLERRLKKEKRSEVIMSLFAEYSSNNSRP